MGDKRISELVRPAIRMLKPYSSARDEYNASRDSMVFLDANENPFGEGLNRYPDPRQRLLKKKIAEWRGIPEDHILLGNGSDEVLDLLFRVFCEPGEERIITLPPTYGMYKVLAGVNAVENTEIPLDESFQPRVSDILKEAGPDTKLLFLCSPNNPTGNQMAIEKIEALLRAFPGLVVVDEAYVDFSGSQSLIHKIGEYPNLVVTQTFSKAMGLAGVRLGMVMAHPEIIGYLNRVKPPYNVNELTQRRALEAFDHMDRINEQISLLLEEREHLEDKLAKLPCVQAVLPSKANFLLVRMDDATRRYTELIQQGIVVRNRSNQHGCENTLRFTVGTPEENQQLVEALERLCNTAES